MQIVAKYKTCSDANQGEGAYSWLTVIPIQEHGFALTKSEFRDALRIRCNKQLQRMPNRCPCSQKNNLNYAMNCKRGGFVVMRHNNVRDFEDILKIFPRYSFNKCKRGNVEHGTFTPLVFSLTGGEGREAFMFHKNIAQKISATTEENYDRVLSLIRCKLSFLICVRGNRSVSNDHVHLDDVFLTGQAAGLF